MDSARKIRYVIDGFEKNCIRGWAVNENKPDEVLNCEVKVDDLVIKFKNNLKRPDLLRKNICTNGLGGFEVVLKGNPNCVYVKFYQSDVYRKINLNLFSVKNLEGLINENKDKASIKSLTNFFVNIGIDTSDCNNFSLDCILEVPTRPHSAILRSCDLKAFSYIGHASRIYNASIGRYCSIAAGVIIGHGNHPFDWLSTNPFQYQQNFRINNGIFYPFHLKYNNYIVSQYYSKESAEGVRKKRTLIGNDVWIGTNAVVLPGVSIGHGAIIGAGSIITKDVPPYAIVAGNPAKIIRFRFTEDIINQLLDLEFWQYAPWDLWENDTVFNDIGKSIESIKNLKLNNIKPYVIENYVVDDLIKLYKKVYS